MSRVIEFELESREHNADVESVEHVLFRLFNRIPTFQRGSMLKSRCVIIGTHTERARARHVWTRALRNPFGNANAIAVHGSAYGTKKCPR